RSLESQRCETIFRWLFREGAGARDGSAEGPVAARCYVAEFTAVLRPNSRENARRMRLKIAIETIRPITTIAITTSGYLAIRTDTPTVKASSIKLNSTFENGSGDVFAVSRVAVLVPCELSASVPPSRRASIRIAGSK